MKGIQYRFYRYLDLIAYRFDLKRRAEHANGRIERCASDSLSKAEKRICKSMWGDYGGDYHSWGFYKRFCGAFNPDYVPDDYYDYAEHVLNLRWSALFLQHKCNLKYFIPSNNRAGIIVQKIDGHFVLEDNTEITKDVAIRLLCEQPVFMAKVARGTGGGAGVKRIVLGDIPEKGRFFDELLTPNDLEFEAVVKQHPFLAQFNPDSVNTFRFLTLNINNHCSVLSVFLRMGAKGAYVDNLSGGNGTLVGINSNGDLSPFGINKRFERVYLSPTGVEFKGLSVPNYDYLKETIIGFHKRIPFANLIGWDVTFDLEGKPVVIEINLDSAVIAAHQVFNGPVFGDRLQEVKEYIEDKKASLLHQMITY